MTLSDLLFIVSALLVLGTLIRLLIVAVLRRTGPLKSTARFLGIYLTVYAALLMGFGLGRPRIFLDQGRPKCFDEWCVAAIKTEPAAGAVCAGSNTWIATFEIASQAQRRKQSASDAIAELEDAQGRRFAPCGSPISGTGKSANTLNDFLEPGEHRLVAIPFALAQGSQPVGAVVHHGQFPGVVIIGDDQSFLHPQTLFRFSAPAGR